MKTFRMLTALAVVALLLVLVPASMAQDQNFGLSAEDMAVLNSANAATAAATSAQFTFLMNLAATSEDSTAVIDLTGTGSFDQDAAGETIFQLSLSGNADMGEDGEMPINADLRVVNGSLYFMAPALLGPQWLEVTPDELGAMTSGMGFDPAALASGDMSSLEGMEGMEGFGDAMSALASLKPEEYVTMSRNGDQFTTTVDLTGLLSSEAFQSFIRSSIAENADAMEESGMSEAEINELMTGLPTALQGSSLTLDQYVTDGMISRTVLTAALNVDPSAIGQEGDAGSLALTFDINLSGYNQDYPVEVPEGAVKLSEMMGGMSSGS